MKHNTRITFTGRFTDEIRSVFNSISEQYPDYSDQQIVAEIIANSKTGTENQSLLDELEDLRTSKDNLVIEINSLKETIDSKDAQISQLSEKDSTTDVNVYKEQIHLLTEQLEKLSQEKEAAEKRANHNAKLLQTADLSKHELKQGEYIVKLDSVADEMLQLTVKRLNEKLKTDSITPSLIFSDLFVKYTIERPCDFAYPPQIPKTEVKVIIDRHK